MPVAGILSVATLRRRSGYSTVPSCDVTESRWGRQQLGMPTTVAVGSLSVCDPHDLTSV